MKEIPGRACPAIPTAPAPPATREKFPGHRCPAIAIDVARRALEAAIAGHACRANSPRPARLAWVVGFAGRACPRSSGAPGILGRDCPAIPSRPLPHPLALVHEVLRIADVARRGAHDPGEVLVFHLAHHAARSAHHEAARGDDLARRDERSSSHERVLSDDRVVEHGAPHPDEASVADGAAVHDRAMSDRHVRPDRRRAQARRDVDDGVVLDVGARPDLDERVVATQDGAEPDARVVGQMDVADDRARFRDEYAGADRRPHAVQLEDRHESSLDAPGARGRRTVPVRRRGTDTSWVSSPASECRWARVTSTSTISPTSDAAPGAWMWTISLRSVRPWTRSRDRSPRSLLLGPSTRTLWRVPTRPPRCVAAICSAVANSRARRSALVSSGTSSPRRSAGVKGRGEYLKPKSDTNPTSRTSESVASKSPSVSPGKPTMTSVESVSPGRARRRRSARATYSARVYRRSIRRRTRSLPDWTGKCTCRARTSSSACARASDAVAWRGCGLV